MMTFLLWTFYFLEQEEIDFLEKLQNDKIIPRLKEYAKVEVPPKSEGRQIMMILVPQLSK